MKKVKLLLINIILAISIIVTITGCGNIAASTSVGKNSDKNVVKNKPSTPKDASTTPPAQPVPIPQKESTTTSVKGKIIVIDPGHANKSNLQTEPEAPGSSTMKIKDGGGAQGVVTKTPEYLVNMNVALKLKKYLEEKGYTVIMTKTDNSVSLGNVERAEIWNKTNASLVIRLHADSCNSSSIKGATMLVPAAINANTKAIYSESKRCGKIVLDNLVKEVGMPNRGVAEHADMTGFNWSKVPVILVEMGFLSNPDEDRLLSTDSYEDKLARALADGIDIAEK